MLKLKEKAPEFSLPDSSGKVNSLKDFLGKKVIVYFYPKDNTPGCTRQACSFRDYSQEFEKRNAVVIGISKDNLKSHQKFANSHNLNFILLSDESLQTLKDYGVFGEKKLYGKTFLGVSRTTYVIDENGYIEKVFEKANPDTNAKEIINFLDKKWQNTHIFACFFTKIFIKT